MDEQGTRTLVRGFIAAFVIYGLSVAVLYVLPPPANVYASIGLTIVSLLFVVVWYIAVRRGFRLGSGPSKAAQRAKAKQKHEQAKLRAYRGRR